MASKHCETVAEVDIINEGEYMKAADIIDEGEYMKALK